MNKRAKFIGVNSIKFNKYFDTDDACYRYLSEIKWNEFSPYHCRKCGHLKFGRGKKLYSRRCAKCNYNESPTTRTMFNKCKSPLLLAFHIAFKINTKKKGMSSMELSHYPNLERVKSDKGNGLPDLHLRIMNIKGWLREIHHHASKKGSKTILTNTILGSIDATIWTQSSIYSSKKWLRMGLKGYVAMKINSDLCAYTYY